MAVQDKYVNSDLVDGKSAVPAFHSTEKALGAVAIAEVAAGDSNDSIYRLFKNLPPELVITDLLLDFDAFGVGGAVSIGLYETGVGGAAYDDNCFASALSVAAATKRVNGLVDVNPADLQKPLWELAGHTLATKKKGYDLAVKFTNVGATGSGTFAAVMKALQS